jgi:predicted nucleic acid-binding protein
MLIIADTGPINYLILIGHIDLLPSLFERVVLPSAVQAELSNAGAPSLVQHWIANLPAWIEIADAPSLPFHLAGLHKGETSAIAVAEFLHADLLLIDDRAGSRAVQSKGIPVTGTIGLLDLAWSILLRPFEDLKERPLGARGLYCAACWRSTAIPASLCSFPIIPLLYAYETQKGLHPWLCAPTSSAEERFGRN